MDKRYWVTLKRSLVCGRAIIHVRTDSYSTFRVSNQPKLHVFWGIWQWKPKRDAVNYGMVLDALPPYRTAQVKDGLNDRNMLTTLLMNNVWASTVRYTKMYNNSILIPICAYVSKKKNPLCTFIMLFVSCSYFMQRGCLSGNQTFKMLICLPILLRTKWNYFKASQIVVEYSVWSDGKFRFHIWDEIFETALSLRFVVKRS